MKNTQLKVALALSIITIVYNILEGSISVYYGFEDETLALMGFGIDSFVEVISGLAVLHLVLRMRFSGIEKSDLFERDALRITGVAFYLLTVGLIIGVALNIYNGVKPETTMMGVLISLVSVLTMWILIKEKIKVGTKLNSEAIIADANCTKTCFYLSLLLLVSSLAYELFRVSYIDSAGTLGIAWIAFKEGREAFEKAKTGNMACTCHDD